MGDKRWLDNDVLVEDKPRSCASCGLEPREDENDPCIVGLPGVRAACCGHGVEHGYVLFKDGRTIRGWFDHVLPIDDE